MKGYSPVKVETASTKPHMSLELGMVEKCDKCNEQNCQCKTK